MTATSDLDIRAAHRADAIALGTFIANAWREAGPGALGFAGATDESVAELADLESLRLLIANEDTTILVAFDGFVIAGFAAMRATGTGEAELAGIVVGADERGHGVGGALVEEIFEIAHDAGVTQLVVHTEPENRPAIRFYETHGFTHVRHVQHSVGDRDMTVARLTAALKRPETTDELHLHRDSSCIFCRIIVGEAPASFVYQDDQVVAFMDLYPLTPGHLLVVPREHRPGLSDLPTELGAQMFAIAQQLTAALRASNLRTEGFNLFLADGEVAMQEVPHAHLHVIPRFAGDGFRIQANRGASSPTRVDLDRHAAAIKSTLDRSVH